MNQLQLELQQLTEEMSVLMERCCQDDPKIAIILNGWARRIDKICMMIDDGRYKELHND